MKILEKTAHRSTSNDEDDNVPYKDCDESKKFPEKYLAKIRDWKVVWRGVIGMASSAGKEDRYSGYGGGLVVQQNKTKAACYIVLVCIQLFDFQF
jgi:hypothetical protein